MDDEPFGIFRLVESEDAYEAIVSSFLRVLTLLEWCWRPSDNFFTASLYEGRADASMQITYEGGSS